MAKTKSNIIDMEGYLGDKAESVAITGGGEGACAPLCEFCQHFDKGQLSTPDALKCQAFPKGIPFKVLKWQADHRFPIEGDRGVRFAVREGDEASFKEWMTGLMYLRGFETPAQKQAKLDKDAKDSRKAMRDAILRKCLEQRNAQVR